MRIFHFCQCAFTERLQTESVTKLMKMIYFEHYIRKESIFVGILIDLKVLLYIYNYECKFI